ncbi:B12-binding domain-containing radical SAM protein [Spirochaeta isovalerica]|uniref:Radical SAM superfamily enzyme YgiQ (UPF0313 family) n=1 Tax=Spirochaeta isovalerica TaxID=150 RepID=A0A841R7T9_9SPIO|nr:radical SAM protein [Spirochaeta isovalerica]MBB6479441.1 radical SAM superfamily enzyme YgiQ (UPF0313 family) [Spirochaeta isovalerica]
MVLKKRRLLRIIIPRFPHFNIYTNASKVTTSIGPLLVATNAVRLDCWDAEVIDENNLHGKFFPQNSRGELDHKKLQEETPAEIVGFYGSISSSIPRLYELARLYKSMGALTIAGGKHIENLPVEALKSGLDYVFFGEAEISIRKFLENIDSIDSRNTVKGIGYLRNGLLERNGNRSEPDELDKLPVPDYHLLRFASMKIFPIISTRGCNMNCEFCAVKGRSRSCSPEYLINTVRYLVETYNAREFFDVSDHFASNMERAIRFLELFALYQQSIGKKLSLTIQTRLTDARSENYLRALKKAGVSMVCIGYESPVDSDLKQMNKGYHSEEMLRLTRSFKRQGVRIHGMFIFSYPRNNATPPPYSLAEYEKTFWKFIKNSRIDSLQLLLAIPLPGTDLRKRLQKNNQLFPIEQIGWQYYDGQYPLYFQNRIYSPEKIQKAMGNLMKRFYKRGFLARCIKNIIIDFPLIIFPSVLTILSGRITYIQKAFRFWHSRLFSNNAICFGGLLILKGWFKNYRKGNFPDLLRKAENTLFQK